MNSEFINDTLLHTKKVITKKIITVTVKDMNSTGHQTGENLKIGNK
jgi:hypothetical protein